MKLNKETIFELFTDYCFTLGYNTEELYYLWDNRNIEGTTGYLVFHFDFLNIIKSI